MAKNRIATVIAAIRGRGRRRADRRARRVGRRRPDRAPRRRPQRSWAVIGSTALSISIVGPSWLADGTSAAALFALHVLVAVVVITAFAHTLPRDCPMRRSGRLRAPELRRVTMTA